MANRKGKLKTVGLITVAFLTGSTLCGGLIAWQYLKVFKQQYYYTILSNASFAHMIRDGREEELLKNIETNIRQGMMSVDSLRGNDENRLSAFWYVQRYYERYKLPVPDDIKGILAKLPPDPRKEEFAASTLISIGDKAPDFTCSTLNGETNDSCKARCCSNGFDTMLIRRAKCR